MGTGNHIWPIQKKAIFYPTSWLYLILPFFIAFKVHYFIHPVIGWLSMFLLAKAYGLSRKAAFFASTLLMSNCERSKKFFFYFFAMEKFLICAVVFLPVNENSYLMDIKRPFDN